MCVRVCVCVCVRACVCVYACTCGINNGVKELSMPHKIDLTNVVVA